MVDTLTPLKQFIATVHQELSQRSDDSIALRLVEPMRELVARDAWLPDAMAVAHPRYYQQHLLHADPADRFSLVSFVWGPGQSTPVHNHTVWGVIGVLRGAEFNQRFDVGHAGPPRPVGTEELLAAGEVDIVSPTHGDVHRVRNAYDDRVSISIHLYGGNIGRIERSVFDDRTGQPKSFTSGYSSILDARLA